MWGEGIGIRDILHNLPCVFSQTGIQYFSYIYIIMAELINQILALPRAEKWRIFAILAEQLRVEEEKSLSIPQWQIRLAEEALKDVETGKVKPVEKEQFWAEIDAKIEQLEKG